MGEISKLRDPNSPKENYEALNRISIGVTGCCQWSDLDGMTMLQLKPFDENGSSRGFLTLLGLERKRSAAKEDTQVHGGGNVPKNPGIRFVRKASGFGIRRVPAGHMQEFVGFLAIGPSCDPESWTELYMFRNDAIEGIWRKTSAGDLTEVMRQIIEWAWGRKDDGSDGDCALP